jgi:acetoacetyl-CoA synthetase
MSCAPLWTPNPHEIPNTHLFQFMEWVNKKYDYHFENYESLYEWSIQEPEQFWQSTATFCQIQFSENPSKIMQTNEDIQKTTWFIDAKLNFAENLLQRRDNHIALIYVNESGARETITYEKLHEKTINLSAQLKSIGVKSGDRIAGFVTNRIETVIAMLATSYLGATWTACGPEFGVEAVLDRFSQIEPTILFAIKTHQFGGKIFIHDKTILELKKQLPSLKKIIYLDEITNTPTPTPTPTPFPFSHPLYILYSSGTTGKPKCMVHGAGNILLQHKKELMLHTDLHDTDILFFYTTCSWMMWHWMISGLSVGATLFLYDGSPFYPSNTTVWDLIDEYDISIFGCGAKIIETYLKNNISPQKTHHLKKLKTILTTGSPLIKESFDYIYRDIKNDLRVSSISGGSDIVSCFALGNPLLPVYAEELQCIGLGMTVAIFDETGHAVQNQTGELVCTQPFPAMPIYFWNDPSGEKYFDAYFNRYPHVWTHGDFAKLTEHHGMIIYGRSDATLNPGGIRIGTADIYDQVLKIPDILDCLAVGKQNNGDEAIILFIKLKNNVLLDDSLISSIKKIIREHTTPFHVPKKIIQVNDIPKTMNGKTMELLVKKIVNNQEIRHWESLANPECLKQFYDITIQLAVEDFK